MISNELLRRYPFFAGLEKEHLDIIANLGEEYHVEAGHFFFHEGDELDNFYLVTQGTVDIVVGVTDRDQEQKFVEHLTGNFNNKYITVSTVRAGDIFAWSALIPPSNSTAGAKATSFSRVVAFDAERLKTIFADNSKLAYLLTQKMAQVIRGRLRDLRIESLSEIAV